MFVHDTSVLLKDPRDTLKTLEAEVKEKTGIRFRRVNRFILLSLCGAYQCAVGGVDPDTAVCLTTENGTVGDTETGLDQLFHQGIYPKPYNFINTMSNTASFYVAQSLQLGTANITLASRDFAFENGLMLMRADVDGGMCAAALVGGVDEAVFSDANLQSRFGRRLKDGSAWLYVTAQRQGALGEIREVAHFPDHVSAETWLAACRRPERPVLAFGIRIGAEEQRRWEGLLPGAGVFDYVGAHGYFDSAPAAGICLFFEQCKGGSLVHINKDARGRYAVVTAESYPCRAECASVAQGF